jgi:hypothetical protein
MSLFLICGRSVENKVEKYNFERREKYDERKNAANCVPLGKPTNLSSL